MTDFADARLKMVDNQLRAGGVSDHRLLAAMAEVPRELFVPAGREALAYADVDHPLGGGRFLAAPTPFARLAQLAEVAHADRVLVVGAGAGYGAAVLGRLAAEVVGLEPDVTLAGRAESVIAGQNIANVAIVIGGLHGTDLPDLRFDVIVFEGMIDAVPAAYLDRLAEGGRLVALVRSGGAAAVATVHVRAGDEVTPRTEFNAVMPPLRLAPPPDVFVF